MLLATWNVNGIRARLERAVAWLAATAPDVVCVQELKCEDAKFPHEALAAIGYRATTHGQKSWNGVALFSRGELSDVERGFSDGEDDAQARLVGATTAEGVRVVSAYCPNGEAVGSEKYAYKMRFYERLRAYLAARVPKHERFVIAGDYNVAPADLDVHDPDAWRGQVLCSDAERAALDGVLGTGLVDVVRALHPDDPMFSWWDYRMLAFPKNHGLRIDHVLASPALASRAVSARVDREARKGQQPSDHAPVLVDFDLAR